MKGKHKTRLQIINGILYKVSLILVVIYFLFIKETNLNWSYIIVIVGCVLGGGIIVTEVLIRRKNEK